MSTRAIIVDPSRSYRKLLIEVLRRHGIVSLEASGISDALHLLEEGPIDMLVMSMTLPDGDSAKFCMQVRARANCAKIPILMLTSSESRDAARRCLAAGVTELFRKQEFEAFGDYLDRLNKRQQITGETNSGTLLYLEDSKPIAVATIKILGNAGYQIHHFARAEDGIEAFRENEYDLVLTDIVLEGQMTGIGLVEAVREHDDPTRRTIPVLAMSGYDDAARRRQLFRAGVDDYVPKPVMPEELLARVYGLVSNRQLLSRLAESHERMQKIAMTDQLTGLHNRHYLMEQVPERLQAAISGNQPLSLMVIDLDHFKAINDQHGLAAGDTVLQDVGALLHNYASDDDLAVRFGGEEFVMLMNGCNMGEALKRAETIRADIAALDPEGIPVSTSIGISDLRIGEDYDALFRRADDAVYEAKAAGRNCVKQG